MYVLRGRRIRIGRHLFAVEQHSAMDCDFSVLGHHRIQRGPTLHQQGYSGRIFDALVRGRNRTLGEVERNAKGETPVVLYRKVAGYGYCYDAVFSPELKSRLVAANKQAIDVAYDLFSDFGQKRGYNLRSVDGLLFNEGERPVRPGEGYGGQILGISSMDCLR